MLAQTALYREERRQEILELLAVAGRAAVSELAQRFGVSEVTIRGDLQALAERGLIVRTHGGAVLAGGVSELALALRRQQQARAKSLIGRAGAASVADGDAIFLDSSSTSLAIAHHLKQHRHVTVVTNSLAVAEELLDAPNLAVVMSGGALQRETASLTGLYGVEFLRAFNLEKGFFGAHGISLEQGLTDVSVEVAEVKRPLAQMCREVIAVLDATKWGRVGVASFAAVDEIDCIITAADAPAELVAAVRGRGVRVVVADEMEEAVQADE